MLEAACPLVHRGTQREGSGKQSLYSDKNLLRHSRSNVTACNGLATTYCFGALRKFQAITHRRGYRPKANISAHQLHRKSVGSVGWGTCSVCFPWPLWLLIRIRRVSTWFCNSRELAGARTWWRASTYSSLKMGKPSCSPSVCTFFWGPWCYGKWVFLKVPGCFCTVTKRSINLSLTSTTSLFPLCPLGNLALSVNPDCCDSGTCCCATISSSEHFVI